MRKIMVGVTMFFVVFVVSGCATSGKGSTKKEAAGQTNSNMSYIDNGVIRLGVDLNVGGAITYLAGSKKKVNVVNNYDWGRQIQMSFYSGPAPYEPNGKKPHEKWKGLGWNPIQSGDVYENRSTILKYKNDGKKIYVKCRPMHWPLNNVPGECTFESWIELKGNAAYVRSRINNNRPDKTQYGGRGQEQPAVYTNGVWWKLMSYSGDKPFTNDELTRIDKKWGPDINEASGEVWGNWHATENWAALLDNTDWGLGVWSPGTYQILGGFFGKPGAGGTKDAPCGYISPVQQEILDYNIVYEYRYVLILGTLDEIRQYVYEHSEKNRLPDYKFKKDRQHWIYSGAKDTGWPIKGELNILLDEGRSSFTGPLDFWRAEDASKLYIKAAYKMESTKARLYWKNFGDKGFSEEKSIGFDIKADGKYRTYELDLSGCPNYKGIIIGLRFDPVETGKKGEWVKIKSISYSDK